MPTETLVIVPTSRGVNWGVNVSNVRLIPANAAESGMQAIG